MPGAGAGTGVFGGSSVVWPWPRQEEQMCKMSLKLGRMKMDSGDCFRQARFPDT